MQPSVLVAVVSGDRIFREVLAASLAARQGLEVIAVAGAPEALTTGEGEDRAGVVLIDAGADLDGALSYTWETRERWPEAKIVVVGIDREDERVVDFAEAGAQGYVLKGATLDELVEVVRAVLAGKTPCSPRIVSSVVARISSLSQMEAGPPLPAVEPLTSREREILALVAAGLGNKEVGRRLRITVQTVKNHVHRILEKLQVHRRREAVRLAYDLGLLAEPREVPLPEGGGRGVDRF
ncbi:MAG TPA: response regulator transcription factor [Thermoanaerobaculia bacterium]|jgi:DNA-binding NarL/FixJ family response regulator